MSYGYILTINLLSVLTTYSFFDKKPSININQEIVAETKDAIA
ncbi:hypothetical protein HMPREF1981_03393 [Bacteroides pyogenes F0041]|uniref:Uncharacterized protein n=1 Tax=Bacteroides pyogenes F0041 TaxID=1321819 RepID=U2DN16_9BACE|nr:hypothetical protein HMPREF1981_03393 [Bacteroides pyogenes F0041]